MRTEGFRTEPGTQELTIDIIIVNMTVVPGGMAESGRDGQREDSQSLLTSGASGQEEDSQEGLCDLDALTSQGLSLQLWPGWVDLLSPESVPQPDQEPCWWKGVTGGTLFRGMDSNLACPGSLSHHGPCHGGGNPASHWGA